MLFFGHVGLTTGLAVIIDSAQKKLQTVRRNPDHALAAGGKGPAVVKSGRSLLDFIDLRVLMIGSLLPDIIDKPVGNLFFREYFHSNGRLYCHTILFLFLISLSGLILYKLKKRTWLLVLAGGTLTHLIFDSMWTMPKTLFWPFLGFNFPGGTTISFTAWVSKIYTGVFSHPEIIISEIVGFIIFCLLVVFFIRKDRIIRFIKTGKI